MRSRFFPFTLVAILALSLTFSGALADLSASEGALDPAGAAFEINPDAQGWLWISDYGAGEIWGLDPQTGVYEIYPVGGNPGDARHDGTYMWWADAETHLLGRVSTADGAYQIWDVDGNSSFFGTALDSQGRFWALDFALPNLYRLEPGVDSNPDELCAYTIPELGLSSYLARDGNYLWLGDWVNERLLRLDTTEVNPTTWSVWSLPAGSTPFALALDSQGRVWYTDDSNAALVRLDPAAGTNQLASYALPQGSLPTMLVVQEGIVWYTGDSPPSLGSLNPQAAASTPSQSTKTTLSIQRSCGPISISPSGPDNLTITLGDMIWQAASYPTLVEQPGWRICDLPDSAAPWGIASADGIWFVDNGRKVLGRIEASQNVYLPLVVK